MNFLLRHYPKEEGLEIVKLLIKIATLVNWENKIWFDLETNLEFYGLEEFIDNCYAEVSQMKSSTFSDKYNLCHFALNGGNAFQTDKSSRERFFDEALETLMKNSFPIYDDYIRVHFDRTFLLEKSSKMNIYARDKEPSKAVHLNSHVILEVASYLEGNDLYNLVGAYSKPDVPLIKNHKTNQDAN